MFAIGWQVWCESLVANDNMHYNLEIVLPRHSYVINSSASFKKFRMKRQMWKKDHFKHVSSWQYISHAAVTLV